MTRRRLVKGLFGLWLLLPVGGFIHYHAVEPIVQMPIYGWNRLLIAAGWFAADLVVAIALIVVASGLPKGDALRAAAWGPLVVQVLLAGAVLVAD